MRHGVTAAVFAGLVALASPASAQPGPSADRTAEAREAFERGLALAEDDRWAEALEHFRRAQAIVDRPSLRFNIGMALIALGRNPEAIVELEHFVGLGAQADRASRREAERALGRARSATARVRVTVEPADATLEVDGGVVVGSGASRELILGAGTRTVRASAAGYETATVSIAAAGGTTSTQSITLQRPAVVEPEPVEPPPDPGGGTTTPDPRPPEPRPIVTPEPRPVRDPVPEPTPFEDRSDRRDRGDDSGMGAWPWVAIAGAAIVVAVVAAVLLYDPGVREPYPGSTGTVIEALRIP